MLAAWFVSDDVGILSVFLYKKFFLKLLSGNLFIYLFFLSLYLSYLRSVKSKAHPGEQD